MNPQSNHTIVELLQDEMGEHVRSLNIQDDFLYTTLRRIDERVSKLKYNLEHKENKKMFDELIERILSAENELSRRKIFGNNSTIEGLEQTILGLRSSAPHSIKENMSGFFIRDEVVLRLLSTNPPHGLIKLYGVSNISSLIKCVDARFILSLTRHTEDKRWQRKYQQLLSSITIEDFEKRGLEIYPVDSDLILPLLVKNNQIIKPWKVSHTKETGAILFFTDTNPTVPTPNLLQTAVFLHYIFEIKYASDFFKLHSQNEADAFGNKLSKLISNARKSYPFLTDKNVYDETLYWDYAVNSLATDWVPDQLAVFSSTTASAYLHENIITSLNFVDMLWTLCLPETNYNYHFKQSLWKDLIQEHCSIDSSTMEEFLTRNLEMDDFFVTNQLISSYQRPDIE